MVISASNNFSRNNLEVLKTSTGNKTKLKRFIQNGTFESDAISDIYGNKELKFKKVGNLISPDEKEVRLNNRSRSAKLRVAEKI